LKSHVNGLEGKNDVEKKIKMKSLYEIKLRDDECNFAIEKFQRLK